MSRRSWQRTKQSIKRTGRARVLRLTAGKTGCCGVGKLKVSLVDNKIGDGWREQVLYSRSREWKEKSRSLFSGNKKKSQQLEFKSGCAGGRAETGLREFDP
jgi:hypothetical protein